MRDREPNDNELDIDDGDEGGDSADASSEAGDGPAGTDSAAIDRQIAEHRDRYLRLAAEYDNYRKRSTKERADASARGQADLVRQLLDPLDDLMRFAHVDPATTDATTLVEGVAMVERKMLKALGALGLEIVNPVDQTFDPAQQEAVATEPAASPEDDHVVARVYQVGYTFNGQLLRPARVVVKQWTA